MKQVSGGNDSRDRKMVRRRNRLMKGYRELLHVSIRNRAYGMESRNLRELGLNLKECRKYSHEGTRTKVLKEF